MQPNIEKTVREIALESPSAIRVFEALGIDYCCGGKKSLGEACMRASLPVDEVLARLQQAAQTTPVEDAGQWAGATVSALIDHIVGVYHAQVRRESARLQGFFAKVAAKHGERLPQLVRMEELFVALSQELSTHLLKEEQVLFPYVARLDQALRDHQAAGPAFFGSVTGPISHMLAEHDDAGELLVQLRAASDGYQAPPDSCPTMIGLFTGLAEFERDLHMHIHLENNILFPRAIAMEQSALQTAAV